MTSLETLVGLHVTDDAAYQRYRDGMMPILAGYGGSFRYDFRVAETLRSATDAPINRVFVIAFPDAERKAAFFADESYLEVKRAHFEPSVGAVTTLAEYVRA